MVIFSEREKRKAQVSGKSSCMVTLPKKWAKDMGLRQGDMITFTRQGDSSLLISCDSPNSIREKRAALLRVSERDTPESIFRKIVSLYILGYDEIKVKSLSGSFTSSQSNSLINQVRKRLVGTEIISGSNESITLQILLGYSELSVEHALKRMLLITSEMQKDIIPIFEGMNTELAREIIQRDDEVDRFSIYVLRQLNSSIDKGTIVDAFKDPKDVLGYIQIARIMERAADNASKIAGEVLKTTVPIDRHTMDRLQGMNSLASELYSSALLSLFKKDQKSAEEIIEVSKTFPRLDSEFLEAVKNKELPDHQSLAIILDSLRRTVDQSIEIAEIVMDLTIERSVKREHETQEEPELALVN